MTAKKKPAPAVTEEAKVAETVVETEPVPEQTVAPPKAKATPKPRVKTPAPEIHTIEAGDPVVVVGDNSPRYEAALPAGGHSMIEDPDTHVVHCKHCHAPSHMADVPCQPREFT